VSSAGAGQYVEAAASVDPFVVLVGEDGPYEPNEGGAREDPDDIGPPPDFVGESLP